jgi:hypothetical protein
MRRSPLSLCPGRPRADRRLDADDIINRDSFLSGRKRELTIVAKALVDGQDVTEIGLMRDIALRTIAVLRDAGRM